MNNYTVRIDETALRRAVGDQLEPVFRRLGARWRGEAVLSANGRVVQKRTGDYIRGLSWVVESAGDGLVKLVFRADANYSAVIEYGSKPHTIRAVNAPYLQFRVAYQAGGGGVGEKWVMVREVEHPGTAPTRLLEEAFVMAVEGLEGVTLDSFQGSLFGD